MLWEMWCSELFTQNCANGKYNQLTLWVLIFWGKVPATSHLGLQFNVSGSSMVYCNVI